MVVVMPLVGLGLGYLGAPVHWNTNEPAIDPSLWSDEIDSVAHSESRLWNPR